MCTGGGRKPTSCANFLRTPLMRASRSPCARLVDQRDQAVADFEAERVDRLQVVPARLGVGLGHRRAAAAARPCARSVALRAATRRRIAERRRDQQEHEVRHARDQAERADRRRR